MKIATVVVSSHEYLPKYAVLRDSLLKYLPNVDHFLYYGGEGSVSFEGVNVIGVRELITSSYYTNDFYRYCSIRPRAVLDCFEQGYDKVILLGCDTEFFATPTKFYEYLDNHNMVFTTYQLEPYTHDQTRFPNDVENYEVGQINADMLGIKKTPETIKFLEWLDEWLVTKCIHNGKVYVDQAWFSKAFSFVDNVKVCRDLGYNVGFYNYDQRNLHYNNGWKMKDGTDLVLYHYAGLEKGKEENVSKHQNYFRASGDFLDFLKCYTQKI